MIERIQKKIVLGFGEGICEKDFLRFLKGVFLERGAVSLRIFPCDGKEASGVFEKTKRNLIRAREFYFIFVLLDSDKLGQWQTTDEAGRNFKNELEKNFGIPKKSVKVFWSKPCLEGLILRMLEPEKSFSQWPSQKCKKALREKMAGEKFLDFLKKNFDEKKLLEISEKVEELKNIISIIKGCSLNK